MNTSFGEYFKICGIYGEFFKEIVQAYKIPDKISAFFELSEN